CIGWFLKIKLIDVRPARGHDVPARPAVFSSGEFCDTDIGYANFVGCFLFATIWTFILLWAAARSINTCAAVQTRTDSQGSSSLHIVKSVKRVRVSRIFFMM